MSAAATLVAGSEPCASWRSLTRGRPISSPRSPRSSRRCAGSVLWHNRRHGRSAHLFRAHALTRRITSDRQLIAACRYLARNPVLADLVTDPLEWPWSSARAHAGLGRPRIPLAERDLRAAFGDADDWRERYRTTVEPDDDDSRT